MPPIEPNRLQKVYNESMEELDPLYDELNDEISRQLLITTPSKAVDEAYKAIDFLGRVEVILGAGSVSSSEAGFWRTPFKLNRELASDYFLFTKFDKGVSLSETIHSGESQAAVKSVVKEHFVLRNNVDTLIDDLSDEFDRLPVVDKKKRLNDGIDKITANLKKSGVDTKLTEKELRKIKQSIPRLDENSRLRKAREKIVKAWEKGDSAALQKAVEKATKEKARYINERIARSEYARSFDMSISRAIEDDPDAIGFEWELSSGHPIPDICDVYSEADSYGMGPGIFPAEAGAKLPAHPNCLCSKRVVYKDEVQKKGRYSQERVAEYLDSQSDKKRALLIGKGNSIYKKDYSTGLKKHGYRPDEVSVRMVSKEVIQRRETE